ncbi:MAG TPA: ABC transporter permease [Gammaproteobacteria bacterium]
MASLLSDIRFSLRGFARRPMFAFVVVATLALGLSINAAIFSIDDQVLLRELRVPAPGDLVNLLAPGRKQGNNSCSNIGTCDEIFSYPMFRDLEQLDGPFVGIAAHRDVEANLAIDGKTVAGSGLLVSGKYFSLLGLTPAVGRLLDTSDDRVEGEANAVVLSYAYWQSGFAGNPAVVGRELIVNGKALTIVGVAPRTFTSTTVGSKPEVFLPITFSWGEGANAYPQHKNRQSYWAYLFARLKPGVSLEQATAAINEPYRRITNDIDAPLLKGWSEQMLAEFRAKTVLLEPGGRGQSEVETQARAPLTILLVSTGLVLLIACVNVANLLLARGSTRVGEIATRASLGASRFRLLGLLLAEVLLLAAGAALVSLPLTLVALRGIASLLPNFAATTFDLGLSSSVVAMTVGLAVVSTLVFGLIPALKLVRIESSPALQSQGVRSTGGKGAARFRTTLTTAQIALSMALLVLAGWFAQSLANVSRVDVGFRTDSLSVFSIAPGRNGYTPERTSAFFTRLEEELGQVPGVTSAGMAAVTLLAGNNWGNNVTVEGYTATPGENTDVSVNWVSPDFFKTLQMPFVSGSEFKGPGGTDRPKVAVVNERFAARFNLGNDAVGKRMKTGGADGPLDMEIVGVVRDAKYSDVKADPPPQLFMQRERGPALNAMTFYLRSDLPTGAVRTAVEQVVSRLDSALPLMDFRTVDDQARENVFLDRFMSTLAVALAVMATVLAAIGIYGVLSYGVVQRLREIGLRIALGAAPGNVRGMVLKQVTWMAGIGVLLGVGLALLIGLWGRALFYGLAPTDPLVPAAALLALTAVVLAAAYWPARRAALVDPVTALRGD